MEPPLCANGCGFYGTVQNHNLCSKCFKEFQKKQEIRDPALDTEPAVLKPEKGAQISHSDAEETTRVFPGDTSAKIRCKSCNKRVGVTGFKCRCGDLFCGVHRYPEVHSCGVDLQWRI